MSGRNARRCVESQTNLRICLLGIEAPEAADGKRLDWPWIVTSNGRGHVVRVRPMGDGYVTQVRLKVLRASVAIIKRVP
jgi:hypothetical protein